MGFLQQLSQMQFCVNGWAKLKPEARRQAIDSWLDTNVHADKNAREGIPSFVFQSVLSDRREFDMAKARLAEITGLDVMSIQIRTTAQEDGIARSREEKQTAVAGLSVLDL